MAHTWRMHPVSFLVPSARDAVLLVRLLVVLSRLLVNLTLCTLPSLKAHVATQLALPISFAHKPWVVRGSHS